MGDAAAERFIAVWVTNRGFRETIITRLRWVVGWPLSARIDGKREWTVSPLPCPLRYLQAGKRSF
jgi:hypothetical protein